MRYRSLACLTAAVALLAPGCGEDADRLAPVRGTVFYKGAALGQGSIVFTPDPLRGGSGPLARAEIQSNGSYVLQTEGVPGAVPGWHRVTIVAVETPPGSAALSALRRSLLPPQYCDPELSGLVKEVKIGRDNVIDFHLD